MIMIIHLNQIKHIHLYHPMEQENLQFLKIQDQKEYYKSKTIFDIIASFKF